MLLKAEVPTLRKLSLIFIFSGAIFVMACGILRAALVLQVSRRTVKMWTSTLLTISLQDPVGGAQAAGSWAVRETFVAVVVCNMPLVYQGGRLLAKSPRAKSLVSSVTSRMGHTKSGNESELELTTEDIISQVEIDARQTHLQYEFSKAA